MNRLSSLTVLVARCSPCTPLYRQRAVQSSMGLMQKIFYFHFPSWMAMFAATFVCGVASARVLFSGAGSADHRGRGGGAGRRFRHDRADHRAALGAQGVGHLVDWDGRATSALVLWLISSSYLLLRRFGGPGSERLSAAVGLFGMFNAPFVYWSVNLWRTLHPKTSVVPTLPPAMGMPLWFCDRRVPGPRSCC